MKKDSEIICVIKDPGEQPIVASIPNTLEALQKAVGGNIETVIEVQGDSCAIVLLCNEEGLIIGLPYNHAACELPLVGPIVAVGVNGEEFVSLTPNQIQSLRRLLREPESDLREGALG